MAEEHEERARDGGGVHRIPAAGAAGGRRAVGGAEHRVVPEPGPPEPFLCEDLVRVGVLVEGLRELEAQQPLLVFRAAADVLLEHPFHECQVPAPDHAADVVV